MLSSSAKITNNKHDFLLFQQRIKQIVNFQLAKSVFKVIMISIIKAKFNNLKSVIFFIEVLS